MGGDEAPSPEFMAGSDVTARWVLLTRYDDHVPEPENDDGSLRPPTEMDAAVRQPQVHSLHRGDGEDAVLPRPDGRSVNRSRREKKRWCSAS